MAKLRLYTIKRKGATQKDNLVPEDVITFFDDEKVYVGYWFFHKKDAERYLKSFNYPELFEVVGMTVDSVKQDNRKNKR